MPKPKVAILHYSTPPVIGGVEFVIEAHARQMAEHGYRVKIVTGQGDIFDPRIPVRVIPEMKALAAVNKRINGELDRGIVSEAFGQLADRIHTRMARNLRDVDVCIIHNVLTMHFNLPLTAALHEYTKGQVRNRRFIAWCHDIAINDPDYRVEVRDGFPWSLLGKPVAGVKYITVSEERRYQLASLFKVNSKEIGVIPDGIDYRNFLDLDPLVWKLFNERKLFNFDLVMLLPARILRRKNIELAVEITRALNQKGMRSALLVTGPPNPYDPDCNKYYKSIKELIEKLGLHERVIFLGELKDDHGKGIRVGNKMRCSLYAACDMLLFPSFREGFGTPLLEAGLAKLPIVCSDIEPLREIGGDDICYIDPKGDPEDLAIQIIEFYNRLDTLPMFKKVIRNYTWEAIFTRDIEPLLMQGTGYRKKTKP